LSATPTTPPPSLETSLESLGGSGSLRLPLWDKASAEFCFARSRDLLTKNPFCLKSVLSNGELCVDKETDTQVPKHKVPQSHEETECGNECYQDPRVTCSDFCKLNKLQGTASSVHSVPSVNNFHAQSDVIQSRMKGFKVRGMRSHRRVLGSVIAHDESALNFPKYKRCTKSAVSLMCKQLQDANDIRKLVPNTQDIVKYLYSDTSKSSLNGNCFETDIFNKSKRKHFSSADDILTEESSLRPIDCSLSSDENCDLPRAACFERMQPFSLSDSNYAKPPSPFTDEAETVFSYQHSTECSSSPPPLSSFLNSLSPGCATHEDSTATFTTFLQAVSQASQKLTDDRNNSAWSDKPKTNDIPVFCESPQPELELCTSFNLTFSSACTSPDLAEYPELDGDLPGLPSSQ
jgi:hypothetical protein